MTRRWKLIVGTVAVLALAGAGTGLAISLGGSASSPTASPAVLPTAQQGRIEKGITARSLTAQAGVVAKEVRHQFIEHGRSLLPPGSRLSIRGASFHAVSPYMATVKATVAGPQAGLYQLVLIREAGRWLLIGTRKLS